MKSQEAFRHFERTLGAEAKAKQEAEVELGIAEAPKKPKHPGGRPRGSSRAKGDESTVRLLLPPRVTAGAAITAEIEGSTTNEVLARWLALLAKDRKPDVDPRVHFTLRLTVGEGAFPEEVFHALCAHARKLNVDPSDLATKIVKEAIDGWQAADSGDCLMTTPLQPIPFRREG